MKITDEQASRVLHGFIFAKQQSTQAQPVYDVKAMREALEKEFGDKEEPTPP